MGDLHYIAVERAKRQPRITTASRIEHPHRSPRPARPRKGDTVETTEGPAFILTDALLATCRGIQFFLQPGHIARPEDGVA